MGFLGTDHLAARCFEGGTLDAKILVEGTDAGTTTGEYGNEALRLARI